MKSMLEEQGQGVWMIYKRNAHHRNDNEQNRIHRRRSSELERISECKETRTDNQAEVGEDVYVL